MWKATIIVKIAITINLGHRHKHIAHLIERQISLTNSIKNYCKNNLK